MVTDSDVIQLTKTGVPWVEHTGWFCESCCVVEDGLNSQPSCLHLFSDQVTKDCHHIQLIACLKSLRDW